MRGTYGRKTAPGQEQDYGYIYELKLVLDNIQCSLIRTGQPVLLILVVVLNYNSL